MATAVLEYSTTCGANQTDRRSGAIVHKITHASESTNEHNETKSYARDHRGLRHLSSAIYSHTKQRALAPLTHPIYQNHPTILYHPNSRVSTNLESHTPTNNATTAITIRIVFDVFGATARVMRSAEDTRPVATELNVFVFCEVSL